ncbi:MAG: 4Fe-4S binding protein [Chloroflexota bacterium]
MRIGTMFQDVVESFFKKPATQLYPAEKIITSDRFRSKLFYNPSACTGCSLCVKDCPSNAIELVTLDRAAKKFVVIYHVDRCIYCGQCAANCKPKCMSMSNEDWELASQTKQAFEIYYGADADIEQFLANRTQTDPGA